MRNQTSPWVMFVLVASLAGCRGHDHDHDSDHAHGDEHGHAHRDEHAAGHGHGHGHGDEVAIGITRWTERLELFAEHSPAVVGQEMPFLAHLTILDGFRAVADAAVTLELAGPQPVSARVERMLRPGIFQPTIVPRAPGTYQARLVVTGSGIDDIIDGFEIQVHASEADARAVQSPKGEGEGEDEGITFLKEQQWQVPFSTAFAARGPLVPMIEVAGHVDTPPGGRAEIGAPVAGWLVAPAQGLPRPGQRVRKGQVLATVAPVPSSPEDGSRARLAMTEAEGRAAAARTALERAERLIADRAISQREVEDARREVRVAEEAVRASRQAAELYAGTAPRAAGTFRLTAPIDGVLVEVPASPGASVAPGQVLFRMINPAELWIRARVPEQDAARLRTAEDASYRIAGLDTWLPIDITGDDAGASLVSVSQVVDPASRTVEIIYALARPDERLRVGGLVHVSVPVGEPWDGVSLPRDAVLEDDGRALVYVQAEGERFEERVVRLGPRAGGLIGVEHGVAPGERVVTRGANLIKLAARAVKAPGHGHVH